MSKKELNVYNQDFNISVAERSALKGHKPLVVWFTGLSGSGKSTIANALEVALYNEEIHTYSLDGDNVRLGLNSDLAFSASDRKENLRRVAEVAKLMMDSGCVVLAAFVSPLIAHREFVKNTVGVTNFFEVFVDTSLAECERRDVKGLYKRARAGEIANFTGISAPFERSLKPSIHIQTETTNVQEAVSILLNQILKRIK